MVSYNCSVWFRYYYRDKDTKEIDIALEHDGILNPIEIKKTSNPGTELIKVLDINIQGEYDFYKGKPNYLIILFYML